MSSKAKTKNANPDEDQPSLKDLLERMEVHTLRFGREYVKVFNSAYILTFPIPIRKNRAEIIDYPG
jgi:hypothetical protein